MDYTIHPIAYIRSDFTDKFGIPRQSGLVPELTARIVFAPEYRDPNALTGIEGYDRLWLIWQFSTKAGGPPSARRVWAATSGAASLPPAAPTGRMRWGCPAWSWPVWKTGI